MIVAMAGRRRLVKDELLDVVERLKRLERDLERFGWGLSHEIAAIEALLDDRAVDLDTTILADARGRAALREAARTGVTSLSLAPNPDGSADVRIDQGRAFRLPPALGELLRILAAPGGAPPHDHLVGWKSYRHVARMLGQRTKGRAAKHYVAAKIWLLREALSRASQNRELVQAGSYGVRFALRSRDTA
jgi:hypothetical protein